jgi:uncharacterized repeat protein (TIGR04076 family)
MTKIIAKVISQQGNCEAGHKVGDEFVIGQTTPPGMCSWAFHTLFPFAEPLELAVLTPGKKTRIKREWPAPTRTIRSSSS